MRDNWLVKFAAAQPTQEAQFRQQIEALPLDQLRDLVDPPSTAHLETFQEKAASAIAEGRRLAHEAGNQLLEKSAQEAAADQIIAEVVNSLSDEDAIKLAEAIANETDAEKIAAGLMGMAGSALKGIGGFAFKHPHAAAAIGGGLAGGLATGNLRGAAVGAGLGYGASKMVPGVSGAVQRGGWGSALQGQKLMGKAAEDINALYKTAMMADCVKEGGGSHDQSWLTQFEGSPLLEQAIGLAEQELQIEIADIQRRQEREARMKEEMGDDYWTKRDIIRARKHMLELQLVAQRNGLGQKQDQAQAGAPAQQPPQQPAQPPTQAQGVSSTQAPLGADTQNGMPKQASIAPALAGAVAGGLGGAVAGGHDHRLSGAAKGALGGGLLGGAYGVAESPQQMLKLKGLVRGVKGHEIDALPKHASWIPPIFEKAASFPARR